jgi:hypothetical protein
VIYRQTSGLFGWFAVNLRQSPQQSGIFLSGGSGWLKSPKKKPRYILATGARDGWGNHIRKPHQAANGYVTVCQAVPKADPWSVGRLHGVNLPQNVFMARGRGQSQRGKKRGWWGFVSKWTPQVWGRSRRCRKGRKEFRQKLYGWS